MLGRRVFDQFLGYGEVIDTLGTGPTVLVKFDGMDGEVEILVDAIHFID